MTDPTTGTYGQLVLSGWIGETPDGTDAAYLLLASPGTKGTDTPAAMAAIARAWGIDPRPGTVTPHPTGGIHVTVTNDLWVRVHYDTGDPDATLTRPVPAEWAELARSQRRVVTVIGYDRLRGNNEPGIDYVERAHALVIGILPVRQALRPTTSG